MGKVYVLRESAEKHSRNFLLFSIVIIGSVFGLAACNNNDDETDLTPVEENNLNDNGVDNPGVMDNNGTDGNGNGNGNGVIDNGVDNNDQNGVNNGTTNNNNNEGVNPNNDSFKDEAEKAIDKTEDAIRGEDGNNKPE